MVYASAFSIEVDYGIENNKRFSIVTLKHSEKFPCKEHIDINGQNILVECTINKTPVSSFPKSKTEFFEIYSNIDDNRFYLSIKPLKRQKLFANFMDLKKDIAIPKERPSESKIWQIVGYGDEIPFLSNKTYSGINFPINIPNTALPYIGELNIDMSPLIYDEGPDLGLFLNIRSSYNNKHYDEVIKLTDEMLQSYSNSIFIRDSMLYKIRAMHKSNIPPDDTLQLAKEWIKVYPADINVPEVLYIIADSYGNLRIYNEARYYFDRIIDEYPDSKYVQYALVGIANNLAINGDKKQPEVLFVKAYESAKDLDTASYVAYNWGKYELENDNLSAADDLFSRIVNANPSYFLKDINESYKSLQIWANNKLYNVAARAGESMLNHLGNDDFKEQLMMDVSLWYELDSKLQESHKINTEFLEIFKDSTNAKLIKERDDNLLFGLNDGDLLKQIEQYDYLIATYPNTQNSKIAYEKKAKALFDLGKYSDVVALKNNLDNNNIDVKNSYIKLIESSNDCKSIVNYYISSNSLLITNNAKKVFDCLMESSLYDSAFQLSSAMLKDAPSGLEKLTWLYNEAKVSYAMGDFNNAALASRDAWNLSKTFKEKQDSGIILFLSLANLNRKSEAMNVFDELLSVFPNNKEMIEVYYKLLNWAIESNDNIALERYAKEIMKLQDRFKTYEHSPFVELNYADVLFRDGRYTQMLDILNNISLPLNNDETQKVRYMKGSAYYELGDNTQSKNEFNECLKIGTQTSFGKLCSEALGLLN
ncbi:hypothetical protein CCY99_01920 [Helicobacter sp. 16-1353]|uniref:DUF7494 domain-containing protein n=1 Tax=Helicobacter sp. 16-1353 TaxID=2004996 RepID=UPI000DCC242B|nr:tetratricopeptide repeat protein [Helicobacter sp. 16-1353]RAX54924.1 hypothetical protein CCY99_01920 [Helicobacter sp. 16-1353]